MKLVHDIRGIMPGFLTAVVLTLCFSILFTVYPEVDLSVSRLFFDAHEGFFLKKSSVVIFLYDSIEVFIPVFIFFCVAGLFFIRIRKKTYFGLGYAGILYLLIALALGPGLIINGILKEFWGRARPSTVAEFGGKLDFTPALVPSDQCHSNCSFASGHASAGFFPMALAFAFPRNKKKFLAAGIIYGCLAGFARIAQGGHFFSDVVFAGLIVYLLSWMLSVFFDRLTGKAWA